MAQGLNASVSGNAQAFGFSITVTVSFGVLNRLVGQPGLFDLFGFAMSAVLAFSLLNLVVVWRLRAAPGDGPSSRATLLGTATDFLAVGAGVACAVGAGRLLNGSAAWLLGPFLAGVAYVLVQSVELAVGREETDQDEA